MNMSKTKRDINTCKAGILKEHREQSYSNDLEK